MIRQKAISAKLDNALVERLEAEAYCSGVAKNRIINNALVHYIGYMNEGRRKQLIGYGDAVPGLDRAEEVGKYILNNLTGGEHENIHFTARAAAITEEELMLRFIRRGIEDFQRHPFVYL